MVSYEIMINWLERLGKWRSHFAGWQLGTRPIGDPECDAVRDHRELSMILRAEVTAITALLINKGIITAEELALQIDREAEYLCRRYEERWPGITATDIGLEYDLEKATGWLEKFKP